MLTLRSPFDRLRVPSEVEGLEERSRVASLNVERPTSNVERRSEF
jgi:hypothetical protein